MRAVTAAGVVMGVLGLAGAVTLGAQQAEKQTAPKIEKTKETKVVTSAKPGKPMVVTVESEDGQEPNVWVRQAGAPALASMLAGGPRLGIEIRDVTKEDVAALRLTGQTGVVVADVVKESAAEKAGLAAKDVIVSLDGESIRSAQQLTRLVRETAPGQSVKLAVVRDGKRMDIDATPAEEKLDIVINRDQLRGDIERQTQDLRNQLNQYRFERREPAAPGAPARPGGTFQWQGQGAPGAPGTFQFFSQEGGGPWTILGGALGRGRLGVTVQELTPELATYFGVKDGVLVASVTADSPAAKAGLKPGDIITTLDGKAVTAASELVSGLGAKTGEVTVGVTRDKKPLTLKATIEAPKAPGRKVVLSGRPV